MKFFLLGFLLVHSVLAYSRPKSVEFSSRVISYTFCPMCEACTGLLLDERNILTSAHCSNDNYLESVGKRALRIYQERARGGYSILTLKYRFHSHPEYDKKNHFNDLMIINFKATKKILFRGSLPPEITSYSRDELTRDKVFLAEGISKRGIKRSIPLQFSSKFTNRNGPGVNLRFAYPEGSDMVIDRGDSGGPVYVERNGVWELVGVMSSINSSKTAAFATWLSPPLASWIQSSLDRFNR